LEDLVIVAILQARTTSSRLPGKVLKLLQGQPMLLQEIHRIKRAKTLDHVVVATSVDRSDDPIAEMCQQHQIDCFRGSLTDVLDRYYHASLQFKADVIVRLTGDCPLIDPDVIDQAVRFFQKGSYDFAGNTVEPTFPDGLDVEVFRQTALESDWREARKPSDREHVTPYIYHHPERFRIGSFKQDTDDSHMRWTVDEPEDYDFVKSIYTALYPANPSFSKADILSYLKNHPELSKINAMHTRNEGYVRSQKSDPH
jgi:spore coat polysaccharide biosynthesis protein SpsF